MANKHYINTVGTDIIVDCGEDISAASAVTLEVKKPGGTEVSWTGAVYNTNYIKYTTTSGDWDETGTYKLQSAVTLSGNEFPGETVEFEIYPRFG